MSSDRKDDAMVVPFEEALNRAGFGAYSYILTAMVGVSILSLACVVYGSTIIVPTSACELETTPAQQGLLLGVPLIGTTIGAVLWGYLADRLGRKSMLLTSFFLGATSNAIASLSVSWLMLLILQFFTSLLASGQYTLAMTMLSESVPMAKRNLVMLLVTSIFMLSQGVMAVLAMPIIPLSFSHYIEGLDIYWNSWRTLLVFYSTPALLTATWLCFMQESPKFVFAKGDEKRALEILRKIHKLNNGNSNEELQVKGLLPDQQESNYSKSEKSVKELFLPPLLKYTAIMTTLSVFLQIGAFMVYVPTIADQFVVTIQTGEGSDLPLCGILASANDLEVETEGTPCALNVTSLLIVFGVGAIQSVVNLLLSFIVNKVGRRNLVMIVTATCGISGMAVNWIPNAIGSGLLFLIFLVGLICLGLNTAISVSLFPTHLRALAVSLTMTGGRVAGFGVIQLLSYLLLNNCNLAFYLFGAILASSALVAAFLPDDRLFSQPNQTSIEDSKQALDTENTDDLGTETSTSL